MANRTQWYVAVYLEDGGGAMYKVTVEDSDAKLGTEDRPKKVAALFEASKKMDPWARIMAVFPVHCECSTDEGEEITL